MEIDSSNLFIWIKILRAGVGDLALAMVNALVIQIRKRAIFIACHISNSSIKSLLDVRQLAPLSPVPPYFLFILLAIR